MNNKYKKLITTVLKASESSNWGDAVKEWEIVDCDEDENCETICICGKEGLRYLFKIHNLINNKYLYPIGSSCIKKFNIDVLSDEANLREKEFELYHIIKENKFIELKGGCFSRKLLKKLYDDGVFLPTKYNDYKPYNDYKFLLDMFNKKKPSDKQLKKSTAIILNSIVPFIRQRIEKTTSENNWSK